MPSSGGKTSALDRKSTRLNSSHGSISYAVFCLNKQPVHRLTQKKEWRQVYTFTQWPAPHWTNFSNQVDEKFLLNLTNAKFFFFFNDTATTEIYTLSLHDALPI